MSDYGSAYMEVYTILSLLDKEEYEKIPKNVIDVIERNKDNEYNFELNENKELKDQELQVETRAILFSLYRDYLAPEEHRKKIIQFQ